MAVMKMVGLTMIGPKKEMEPVAREMVLTGGFQPLPLDILLSDRNLRSKVTTSTENPYDELLSKVVTIWKVAGARIPEPVPAPIDNDFTLEKARFIVEQQTNRLGSWEKARNELIEEEELLSSAMYFIKALGGTRFTLSELAGSEFVNIYFGRLSTENYTRLCESAEESPIAINGLTTVNDNIWLLIMAPVSYGKETEKLLNAVYFKRFSLEKIAEEISGENPLEKITAKIEDRRKRIKDLSRAAEELLSDNKKKFEKLFSQLYTMQRVYDLCKGRGEVSGMFLLSGWIPEDTLAPVKEKLAQDAPNTSIMIEDTKDIACTGIKVPTILSNTKMFRAFQDIVAMYSLPSYGEIDPSPIVAISFVLFFGFMFGDIGHGLMIFLITKYLMNKNIIRKSLGYVMQSASISSMIFGTLYGSIFGMEEVIPALWLSPMKDTSTLILVAICIGVFMITLGLVLNMVQQYRNRDFGRLLFDGQGLAGLTIYWTVAILAATHMAGYALSPLATNIMTGGIVLMLLLMVFRDVLARYLLKQDGEEESVVLNIFEIMHNLMSFVSNTASFVRLAAFALNHVGLSMAVIMLSNMVHSLPGGIVMKGLILLLGNFIIVGLEGLIVFIQTLRLEYYEFFGKFYKGGGNAFKPIQWNKK